MLLRKSIANFLCCPQIQVLSSCCAASSLAVVQLLAQAWLPLRLVGFCTWWLQHLSSGLEENITWQRCMPITECRVISVLSTGTTSSPFLLISNSGNHSSEPTDWGRLLTSAGACRASLDAELLGSELLRCLTSGSGQSSLAAKLAAQAATLVR